MSFTINKARESLGLISPSDLYSSPAIKQFNGAFSMGTSQRSALFTIDKYQPGPGTYDVIGVKNSLPKWKFSNSQRNVFISNKNPSPMEYTSLNSMGKGSPTYTFGGKPFEKNEKKLIGPGSYDPILPQSKFLPAFSFGYKTENKIMNATPGPGTYHKEMAGLKNNFPKIDSDNSKSKLKTSVSLTKEIGFSTSQRDDFYNKEYKNIPGPGSYDLNYRANYTEGPSYKFIYGPKSLNMKFAEAPGPGHFSVNEKSVYANSPQITISGKYKNLMDENISARHNPGPGAYNPNHITKIPDIRFQKSSKNLNFSNENPGPGYYDIEPQNKNSSGISFATGRRANLGKETSDPGPGQYEIISKNQGPKVPILGRHDDFLSLEKVTPGPGKYSFEENSKKNTNPNGSMISKTKKVPVSKNFNPGPGQYNVYTTVLDSGPKYTFGSSLKKKAWKRLNEPGPGAYDIPSTIAAIPSYLLNNTQIFKSPENSKYSEYIKAVNEGDKENENYPE